MKSIFFSIFILLWACTSSLTGQPAEHSPGFHPPVGFRMLLSGTFGELRSGHFHSGIDIKTNGRTGEKIYSIDDGYVSRIKVSPFGFGKTLYVTHPGGYVSVYAHLDRFNAALAEYTKEEQYRLKSYSVDFFPEKGELPVNKGQVIAYSGNSGSSSGPHLHFEIRDEATQRPLNPLKYGFGVKDHIRPKIRRLRIYPAGEGSTVNGRAAPVTFQVEGWGEVHRLPAPSGIRVTGAVAFGVDAFDLLNDASNKNGVYSVSVSIDGEEVFLSEMTAFSFSETRYINSLIDYGEYVTSKVRYQRTEIDPNNELSIYRVKKWNGRYLFNEERPYEVVITVMDIAGNTSKLTFTVTGTTGEKARIAAVSPAPERDFFYYDRENHYEAPGIRFYAPEKSFYRPFRFEHSVSPRREGAFSDIHKIHDEKIPVHQYCDLYIEPSGLPEALKEKSLIGRINRDGGIIPAGGGYKDGYVTTRIREFGEYCVVVDTLAPEIIPHSPRNVENRISVNFTIRDRLSGIKTYEATLNGEWLLMEYDAKNDLLTYFIDERLKAGENDFVLKVTDRKDNESVFKMVMER